MAYQERLHRALPRPTVVAYLAAHAEALSARGVFKGKQTARTVFLHLCLHPGASFPAADREPRWHCPVETDHCKPDAIAKATGIDVSNVRKALDWLDAENFIRVERTSAAPKARVRRKAGATPRMGYGRVTILTTNRLSDYDRLHEETRRKVTQGLSTLNHPVPPAKGRSTLNKGGAPLIDSTEAPAAPSRPKRTVARTRATWANADGSGRPATLKPEAPGRRPVEDAESPGIPVTRSEVGAPGGCGYTEAGLLNTDDTTESSTTGASSSHSHDGDSPVARTGGRKPAECDGTRVRAYHGDSLTDDSLADVLLPGVVAAGLVDSPGYRAGDDRIDLDVARFRLYYDTGLRGRQHSRMPMA
jgi:hypothetical protein